MMVPYIGGCLCRCMYKWYNVTGKLEYIYWSTKVWGIRPELILGRRYNKLSCKTVYDKSITIIDLEHYLGLVLSN